MADDVYNASVEEIISNCYIASTEDDGSISILTDIDKLNTYTIQSENYNYGIYVKIRDVDTGKDLEYLRKEPSSRIPSSVNILMDHSDRRDLSKVEFYYLDANSGNFNTGDYSYIFNDDELNEYTVRFVRANF